MKLQLLTISLVALAGALITPSAHAQYVAANEDLILSFQDANDPNDLQIDIGNISAFTGTPSFTSLNLSADLTAQFGSGWYSDSNLAFSIVGANTQSTTVNGYAGHSIFASDPVSALISPLSSSNLNTPEGLIGQLSHSYGANAASGTTPNSDIVAKSTSGSYSILNATGNFKSLYTDDGGSTVEATFGQGVDPQLFLDILTPGASNFVTDNSGNAYSFDINSSGLLTFSAEAAPEPSTYALMFLGAGALVVLMRRKSVSSL